jgi:hypothetical protein
MNSSHCLAAPNIGGYIPKRNHREKDRAIERRLIGTLHLAEKSIPRFKIGHPDYATDRHRLGPLLARLRHAAPHDECRVSGKADVARTAHFGSV